MLETKFFSSPRVNHIVATFVGILVTAGWWCLLDCNAYYGVHFTKTYLHYYVPGIIETVVFFYLNLMCKDRQEWYEHQHGRLIQFLVFLGFLALFGSFISACYIFVNGLFTDEPPWTYVSVFVQNLFILLGTFLYYFGITIDPY